jgi:acetoin utilization deacetylase AcuC-like enzyme
MTRLAGFPVVWAPDCLLHRPGGEVWLGVADDGTEVPERAEAILSAVRQAGAAVVPAQRHGDEILRTVHDDELIDHLRTVWTDRRADAFVVSLGVDAAAADPESPLRVSAGGYRAAGQRLGRLGPTVLVQEGGYDLASLGALVAAVLGGVAAPVSG